MSSAEREKLHAEETALRQRVATLNRGRVAAEREEDRQAAERERARLQAEAVGVLPGSGGVATLAPAKVERHDFDAEIADLDAECEEISKQIGETAVADAPIVLEDFANATETARGTFTALGEPVVQLFIDALAALEKREEAEAAVNAVKRDFRGPPKVVAAQRSAMKRYERDLLADATQAEVIGLYIYQTLQWARRGSSPLEKTWRENDISLLGGSVLTHAPAIGGVVAGGRLPL